MFFKIFFSGIASVIAFFSYSQSLVNTTGATIQNGSITIEYSVGEIAITTIPTQTGTGFVTQGLLQTSLKIVPAPCDLVNDTVQYFPNPVVGLLSIVTRYDWITGYRIYAADGKLIRVAPFISNQVDFTSFLPGIYFIKIFPGCNDKFRILKVIKQ